MRRRVVGVVGVLLLVVGFAEWQVQVVRTDYQEGRLSSTGSVRVVAPYLSMRQRLFADPGLVIATAFQLSRQPGHQDFVSSMRQAGHGFELFKSVFADPGTQSEWRNEASFQALTLLVRMPWDDELAREASGLSMHLREALARDATATPDERRMVEELQELVVMRHEGMPAVRKGLTDRPLDERDGWQKDLQELRLGLASCLKSPDPELKAAWSALERGFGRNWLHREWILGWDAGLLQTVQAARISADCMRLTTRVASMAQVASISPSR
ncbi:hypothetical protein MCEMSEM18_02109 [Comamonadaceae bacterium]